MTSESSTRYAAELRVYEKVPHYRAEYADTNWYKKHSWNQPEFVGYVTGRPKVGQPYTFELFGGKQKRGSDSSLLVTSRVAGVWKDSQWWKTSSVAPEGSVLYHFKTFDTHYCLKVYANTETGEKETA